MCFSYNIFINSVIFSKEYCTSYHFLYLITWSFSSLCVNCGEIARFCLLRIHLGFKAVHITFPVWTIRPSVAAILFHKKLKKKLKVAIVLENFEIEIKIMYG